VLNDDNTNWQLRLQRRQYRVRQPVRGHEERPLANDAVWTSYLTANFSNFDLIIIETQSCTASDFARKGISSPAAA